MTRKALTMAVAALAMAALPWVAAEAQEAPGPPPHRHEGGFGPGGPGGRGGPGDLAHLGRELGLTDDQKAQAEAIHTRQRETLKPLMDAARDAHEAFRQSMETDGAEAAAVGQAALAMRAAEKKLQAAHQAAFEEFKAILTPDQRTKLEQMKESRRPHGPGRPQPPQ
jgi:Spy/CpxP family protein refolding chaperone